ncbi:MAG: hypothetical protein U0230_25985 [Polyangiales bacterium]
MSPSSRRRGIAAPLAVLFCLFVAGCDDSSSTPVATDPKVLYADGCDPLVPTVCGYPFPSDIWLVDDPSMPTGHHVEMPDAFVPTSSSGGVTDLTVLRRSDGFSPGVALSTHLPGATKTGLPDPLHIEDSLLADAPTVLLDTVTGERVPHWTELDMRSDDTPNEADTTDDPRALMIRPAVRLEDGRRYIVAIRHVVDVDGAAIAPSPAFRALRDGKSFDHPSIGERRGKYRDIFARLAAAGVSKRDLQMAWDFTTSSTANQTGGMLAMRDSALAWLETLPSHSPSYRITSVQDNVDAHIARRIAGFITVPMYLDKTEPGGVMTYDDAGMPVQQGMAEFPFLLQIPYSATTQASPVLHFGHGLFGDYTSGDDSRLRPVADQLGMVLLSLDWLGLTGKDLPAIGALLTVGDLSKFRTVPERGMQAMLNNILALRMVQHGLANDPVTQFNGHATIDSAKVFYWGASLGGIYGATYMALTPDIERGVLGVPGQSFDLLLPRSVHFDLFLNLLSTQFPDFVRYPQILAVAQMLWDRVDPTGYSKHVVNDLLPGSRSHQVFLIDAIGDHQVTTLGAHVMARAIGVPLVGTPNRLPYGIPNVAGPVTGSGFVEVDFGLPAEPITNIPARAGNDPHDAPWTVPVVLDMMNHFALTGEIANMCSGSCNPD